MPSDAKLELWPTPPHRGDLGTQRFRFPDVGTLEKVCRWIGEDTASFTGVGDLQIAFKNRKAVPMATARSLAVLIEKASKQFADEVDARGH